MKRATLMLLLLCSYPVSSWSDDSLIACSDQMVAYSAPAIIKLKDRVVVKKLPSRPKNVLKDADPGYEPYSPQRTAAFNRTHVSDTSKAEQRDNELQIFTVSGPVHAWQLNTYDMMDNLRARWINDDLIFIQVWWGRIVTADLIFQVSSGKFLYAQEANYGTLIQPCK